MLQAGEEVEKFEQGGKGKVDQTLESQSYDYLPASDDLTSVIGSDCQTLAEFLEFISPPDILLEDELCWPVKPNLDY